MEDSEYNSGGTIKPANRKTAGVILVIFDIPRPMIFLYGIIDLQCSLNVALSDLISPNILEHYGQCETGNVILARTELL